jgi:D-arginine dehydrogenase
MSDRADIVVIGAGMAGASLAAELAPHASVIILEAEAQPGYHSTGRSAAFWSESYGGPLVQPLTTASGPFLWNPPADFSDTPFLHPRGALHIADPEGETALDALVAEFAGSTVELYPADPATRIGGLRPGWGRALFEPSCADIDVAALHGAYLKAARRCGAMLRTNARAEAIERSGQGWSIHTPAGRLHTKIVVNAAGAWADEVAVMAGVAPIGIRPYRRTLAQLRIDPPAPPDLPLVIDALGRFYFKPEAGGRLWLSPHDETPCEAADCAAEEIDVARAIHWLEQVVDWRVDRVEHSWAGLRSFAPDRLPVYGFDAEAPGFFWFAGQGGFGIQTAPAAARLGAALLLGRKPDPMVAQIDPVSFRPGRFVP